MLKKILIANRGEIACRVMRTARRLGIGTVAVYSDADRNAQHRLQADEAIHLPGNLPRETYLLIDRIIAAARQTGADAIHPGYGFLSENATFAQACHDAGIAFIGPPPSAIEAMGSKSAAKRLMEAAGVPLVPGYHGKEQDDALLLVEARRIGFPVLLKAAAGGGGKGMRAVLAEAEFTAALAAARREAMNSFGDDQMLVEKYLLQPRHVEVQVFCDAHGNGVYLFERDCSIQRRHQKIVEEAPAPGMTAELRARMGEVAVKAAQAIGYQGAGTIEFLLDVDGSFFFMEMNTRLQVEHPVTEFITGQDLVEWQLRVAAGEPLPLRQDELRIHGHAIEVRLCAEDTDNNFLPSTGRLALFRAPTGDPKVRLDTGVVEGDTISPFYDPMIAKLICHGATREEAATRLATALRDIRIAGVASNTAYLHRIVASDAFRRADLDTRFIERHAGTLQAADGSLERALALTACAHVAARSAQATRAHAQDPWSPWLASDAWEPAGTRTEPVALHDGTSLQRLTVTRSDDGYRVQHGTHTSTLATTLAGDHLVWQQDAQRGNAWLHRLGDSWHLFLDGEHHVLTLPGVAAEDNEGDGHGCRAPMHGRVVALLVEAGAAVKRGQPLLVMEAMKMEHQITAPADGTVGGFHYQAGDLVDEGASLLDFDAATETTA